MNIIEIIEKKKLGNILNESEIKFFIDGVTSGAFEDYQITALLMAIYFRGMNIEETTLLTKYMAESGNMLDLSDISKDIIDKHSTGGVGDKISLIFLPLIAAGGLCCAKLSGRGLAHTGGTIDKLESIPNFRAELTIEEFKRNVKEHNVAIAAQTNDLAPADGKLYALRDVTSTVDIIPLMASSIVSKKIASGANHIILDVKYGDGAFLKTPSEAEHLSEIMVEIGHRLGRNISAVISNMNEPLGRAVGNSIEIEEVIEFLKGNMESDLKELTYAICRKAFQLAGRNIENSYLDELIYNGSALEKFKEMINAQGGDMSVVDDYSKFKQAKIVYEIKSNKEGYVNSVNAMNIARGCKKLGAGRAKKSDRIDYSAGVYLNKKSGEYVKENETLAIIYTNNEAVLNEAKELILSAYKISNDISEKESIVYKVIG